MDVIVFEFAIYVLFYNFHFVISQTLIGPVMFIQFHKFATYVYTLCASNLLLNPNRLLSTTGLSVPISASLRFPLQSLALTLLEICSVCHHFLILGMTIFISALLMFVDFYENKLFESKKISKVHKLSESFFLAGLSFFVQCLSSQPNCS